MSVKICILFCIKTAASLRAQPTSNQKTIFYKKSIFFYFLLRGEECVGLFCCGERIGFHLPLSGGDILQMAGPRCGIAIWFNSLQPLARQLLMFAPLFVSLFGLPFGPLA